MKAAEELLVRQHAGGATHLWKTFFFVFLMFTSNLQQSWGAEVSKRERDYRKE